MNSQQLMKKYKQLTAKPLSAPSMQNESGESVQSLFQSPSLRILLLRTVQNPSIVSVEVEIWLPNISSANSSEASKDTTGSSENKMLGVILAQMIKHLQYLLRLHESGFTLDVIKHDCLWTASKVFETPPGRELFDLLLPP
ncbi:MAG: hypothetical protein ACFFCH_07065 [Promethearchaeota archaeon]